MSTMTVSTKGQVVIPAEARRQLGIRPGDVLSFEVDAERGSLVMSRQPPLSEMRERFSSWIRPGTPPLTDPSELYETREPRL